MANQQIFEQGSATSVDAFKKDDLDQLPTEHGDMANSSTAASPGYHRATSSVDERPQEVWVNLRTSIFHRAHRRWFQKTRQGELMSRREALGLGYKAAANGQ